jgi:curli biogenesis system outer membrane secretion channel CsgG
MDKRLILCAIFCFCVAGCVTGSTPTAMKLDASAFIVDRTPKENIPPVCKSLYESSIPKVAIAPFSNNTPFDYAKEIQANVSGSSERNVRGGAAAGAAPGGVGVVWGVNDRTRFQKDTRMTQREMNSKLSESVEEGVMDQFKSLGGVKVYTRKDLSKVFDEMKLQQSGMVDETTAVKLGKLAGVRYIVTGSFNNIAISYKSLASVRRGSRDVGNRASREVDGWGSVAVLAAGVAGAAAAEANEGWKIDAEVIVRIIDVETGEVLFSEKITGRENIGKMPYPGFAEVVGAVKKAASQNMSRLKPALAKQFIAKGYILQIKTSPDGKDRIALINIGRNNGLNEGTRLFVYTFTDLEDPLTGKRTCDQSRLPITLNMTEQLQADKAWVMIEGNAEQIKRVRAGQLVETQP